LGHSHSPRTAGRLIRQAWLYDPLVWLTTLGQARKLRALPLDLAAIRPGERVLDVGCGTGDLTLAAAARVGPSGRVYGIDASPEMIALARRKARRRGQAVQFALQPVEALTFAGESFDVVLSSLMMHHLPGDLKRRALAEIRRVLRPGRRVVIVDLDLQASAQPPRLWQPGGLAARLHGRSPASAAPTPVRAGGGRLPALLQETGFVGVESGPARFAWIGYVQGRVPELAPATGGVGLR